MCPKLVFVKGGPPKTGVGKGFGPVPEYYMTMGLANPSQRLGWSRTAGFSHMRVSGRYQGHLGPLKRMSPRCLPQYGGVGVAREVSFGNFPSLPI